MAVQGTIKEIQNEIYHNRKGLIMKKIAMAGLITVLIAVCQVRAADKDFTTSGEINVGENWDVVSVYNDPTVVDMFGGTIQWFHTYDSSTTNIYGGDVLWGIYTYNSSRVNIYGGNIDLEVLGLGDSSTLNVYGGGLDVGNAPAFSELSTVNIYGYGFDYDGAGILTGFLQDDSPFIFRELPPSRYAHINLIPEPATILLFGLGGILLRKRN